MPDLLFIEKTHTYLLNGRPVPCVSDLCRFLSREVYGEAPPWMLEQAADRGTKVHAATCQMDVFSTASIEECYAPYLQAYAAFLRDHAPQWLLTEKPLYSAADDFAGTIDRYGIVSGLQTLIDIKTTYAVQKPLCRASLNLYRRLLEENGHPVDQQLILHLRKDGTYKLHPFSTEDQLPDALLTIHRSLHKCRKEKKHV